MKQTNSPQNLQYGKLPPHSEASEQVIIGLLLMGSNRFSEVMEVLPSGDRFYKDQHQRIYNAMIRLNHAGSGIDMTLVMNELIKAKELELIGGAYALAKLTESVSFDTTIMRHAVEIADCYKRREAIRISGEMMTQAYDMGDDITDSIHEAEKVLLDIVSEGMPSAIVPLSDCVIEFNEALQAAMSNKGEITGVDTGFGYLNQATNGWQNGDLIILAARPGCGKTAFALNLAMNAATSAIKPVPVAFFSLEMSRMQLVNRVVSATSCVDLKKIQRGQMDEHDITKVQAALQQFYNTPLYIDDTFNVNINRLRGICKKLKREKDVGLIIIDYLQLMSGGSDKDRKNREQEIATISRGLKGIAKELNVPVIALSQLSREVEKRGGDKGKVPQLSDIRESGAIEQDADIVMFIYHNEDENGQLKNYVNIAKGRNVTPGTMDQCIFFGNIQKWMNPYEADEYQGKTGFKAFAGMPSPDERLTPKVKLYDDTEDGLPF